MDTKTPPIPLKQQDKIQPAKKQQHHDETEVSLPPLASNHRPRSKSTPAVHAKVDAPTVRFQQTHRRRPFKVLPIGATPLMHACQQADRARVLKLLKEQEGTVGFRDRTLRSALHYCMDAGTGGAVAAAAPELVNSPDAEGHTPLHLAVIAGDTQLVAVLLANGADVNAKDLEGHSVLHWATVCGEAECVRLVLAAGAKPSTPDLRGGSPLHYAAQCCGAAATAELAVPKKVGMKVLLTLLEFGADVNAKDEDGRQPILWAASAGSVDAILALVRSGGSAIAASSDKDGLTALHCAASRGHARCIEALVNLCDSQPDHVDDNGCSALHYAATLGHADATSLLIKLGADPNRQDRKGRTPALCAAAKGQLETLKILAQYGGSLQARTVRGTGIVHEAVASGRIELVKWLVKKRPNLLDVATPDGKTPLHVAALHGHLDVCKLLLDNGARVNAVLRTNKGSLMTALDAALYRGHRDCAKLIQLHSGMTSQHLKAQKSGPCKVFSAKVRVKRSDSTSESDTSPRRSNRRHREPEIYYEERWVERRSRRRGNQRKLTRQGSRSFSEEELRLSKVSSDRQRRALSESARYEDEDNDKEKISRKKDKRISDRKSKRRKREMNNSSSNSEEEETNGSAEESSVSDDSLEVVVVKKSVEKKSKKVVSGRKSKTPREQGRALKAPRKVSKTEKIERDSFPKKKASTRRKSSTRDDIVEKHIYDKDDQTTTDSASQDTVETVTVTAMIHKNEIPDSPQKTEGDKEDAEEEASNIERLIEQADELHNSLLTKAADLKKDVEEMRLQKSTNEKEAEEEGEQKEDVQEHEVDKKVEEVSTLGDQQEEKPDLQIQEESIVVEEKPKLEDKVEVTTTPVAVADTKVSGEQSEVENTTNVSKEEKQFAEIKEKSSARKSSVSLGTTREEAKEANQSQPQNEMDLIKPITDVEKKSSETEENSDAITAIIPGSENFRFIDDSSSSSPQSVKHKRSRPSTGKSRGRPTSSASRRRNLFESSEDRSPDRSAIVAVIESPEWAEEEEDEEIEKEIRKAIGESAEADTDGDEEVDDGIGVVRVLPSTSEEETPARTSGIDSLPQLKPKPRVRMGRSQTSPDRRGRLKQRRDSGGRDSGIEPSPRVSRIPRRNLKCCPNTEKHMNLNMETITRDVQISLRRYHLERKIFFQLMELKRLQIRHGKTNEHVLVKRQVEAFHKAGMSGPALGVAKYDQPLTFRNFEIFLYEQLRKLQRRPASPDWCTEAKQCTQKTHRCHHATSAYTSMPIYTYLGGGVQEPPSLLPRIESRGRGQMTVEVTHGEEKQVIALPAEKLDRTKRYFVTFTVRGEQTTNENPKPPSNSTQRNTKSV